MWWNAASCCEFYGTSIETDTTTWSEFPNGGRATVEQIASEEINKSKRAGLWESLTGIQVFLLGKLIIWVNHLSKVVWDRKIITELTRSISSTRIGKPFLITDVKVSKDKHSREVDQENLIYTRWNNQKLCIKRKKVINRGKKVKHWVK